MSRYSEIILSTHAFVPKKELRASAEQIREQLTITSRYEESVKICLAKETESHFGYPLYMHDYAKHTSQLIDQRTPGTTIQISMAPDFQLRDNQKPLLHRFHEQLTQGRTGWLINMPTGSGKTVCALKMIADIGRTTLIIVPRDSLMNQWAERIQAFTDVSRDEIGWAQQDVCDYEGKKIVLGMIHSLAKNKYPQAFCRAFGLVIWDEVHVAAALSFSQTLSLFAPRFRIGMSATLHRRDGLTNIYRYAIGEEVLSIDKQTLVQPAVYLQEYTPEKADHKLNYIKNFNFKRAKLISSLAKDDTRNTLVARHIAKIAASGRRIVAFSERIEQLNRLHELLIKELGLEDKDIGIFTGETREADRQEILAHSIIILATYGVMSMGVDVPDLRGVVFATPQANIAQAVGRVLRLNAEALDPIVVDIVDTCYQDCRFWAASRKKYYQTIAMAKLTQLPAVSKGCLPREELKGASRGYCPDRTEPDQL